MDETSFNLRAYFDRVEDSTLRQYSPLWSDDELAAWDGNFKSDGTLLLPRSERDVDVASTAGYSNDASTIAIESGIENFTEFTQNTEGKNRIRIRRRPRKCLCVKSSSQISVLSVTSVTSV